MTRKIKHFIVPLIPFLFSCHHPETQPEKKGLVSITRHDTIPARAYEAIKSDIRNDRRKFADRFTTSDAPLTKEAQFELTGYWIKAISVDLFSKWQNTPWDFNGTSTRPGQGAIACGYFVTTLLQDMDLKLNRARLSTCASSEMMKSLVPRQPVKMLNSLTYTGFNNRLKEYGKGVYVIGLDFHTGFIVNDGTENWFIHSNYIERKGVTKETVTGSAALKASKTRWLVSLTGDTRFLQRWLKG